MKTIELPQASPEIANLLDQARADDLIVRLADGSEFLLVSIDEFDNEIARTRANPKLMAMATRGSTPICGMGAATSVRVPKVRQMIPAMASAPWPPNLASRTRKASPATILVSHR